jgi:hypothetical protein
MNVLFSQAHNFLLQLSKDNRRQYYDSGYDDYHHSVDEDQCTGRSFLAQTFLEIPNHRTNTLCGTRLRGHRTHALVLQIGALL